MKPKNRVAKYLDEREREPPKDGLDSAAVRPSPAPSPGIFGSDSFGSDSFGSDGFGSDGTSLTEGARAYSQQSPSPEVFSTTTVRTIHGWELQVGVYLPAGSEDEFQPRLVALHGWGQSSIASPWWGYLDFLDMSQLLAVCRSHEVELILPQAPWRNWTRLRSERSLHTLAASVNDFALDEDGNHHYPGTWLAGFSDGANMAQHAFTQAPARWQGMILAGAQPIHGLHQLAEKVAGKTIILQSSPNDPFSTLANIKEIESAFVKRNNVLVIEHKSLTPYRVPVFKHHRWDSASNESIFLAAFAKLQPQEEEL